MNIAIFTPSQNPYSETFIQAHKKYLKDQVYYFYGTSSNMKLEGHPALSSKFGKYISKIKRLLFKRPWYSLWTEPILMALNKNKIDCVLIEYGTHAYHLLPLLKQLEIPFTVHFHGYDASIHDVIESCNQYKEVFEISHRVIAVSNVMEQRLLNLGCPKEKLVYNVYGPHPEFHDVIPKFAKKQFISIGRFTDKKAPYYTIFAFQKVLKKYPDATLLMAGKGELLNTCKNLVNHLKIEANVEFMGVINPDEFRNYLSESLAFIQHSITADNGDMEGTPLAVLEASAAGLPVISTIHAGIPDVIINFKTGLLCNEHDVESMATNMIKILEEKEIAKEMGKKGKQLILDNYSLERHIKELQGILA